MEKTSLKTTTIGAWPKVVPEEDSEFTFCQEHTKSTSTYRVVPPKDIITEG